MINRLSILSTLFIALCVSADPTTQPAEPSGKKSWDKAPEMQIDVAKTYLATMETSKGKIVLSLFAKDAPKTVNSFVFLAKQGFYNGVIFHRVIPVS